MKPGAGGQRRMELEVEIEELIYQLVIALQAKSIKGNENKTQGSAANEN
jgi:hypothetical protein